MQAGWLTGLLSRALPLVRDRLLADPRFLFLVIAEMAIDSGTAPTLAALGLRCPVVPADHLSSNTAPAELGVLASPTALLA